MRQDFRIDRWIVQPSLNRIYSIAEDPEAGPVEPRTLGHKVMAVLVCLAERPGEVVTREELLESVWEGAFTTDEALATAVYELRKALDDDARKPRYVETIRKRGYRLIAPISPPAEVTPAEAAPAEVTPPEPGRDGRQWTTGAVLPAFAGMAVVAVAVTALLPGTRPASSDPATLAPAPAPESREIRSLVVQPLVSFTEECRQDFFAGGLTEMLIANLVYLGPFDVIATPKTDGPIAPDPRADAILEGSVLRSGDRLWISIHLVDSADNQILWGGTYERELGDSLDLQRELSLEISHQIVASVAADLPP